MNGSLRAGLLVLLLCSLMSLPYKANAQTVSVVNALQYKVVFTKGVSLVVTPNQDMQALVLTIRTFEKSGSEQPQQTIILEDLKKDVSRTFTLSATGDQYLFQFQPAPDTWAISGDCVIVSERHLTCGTRKMYIPTIRTPLSS